MRIEGEESCTSEVTEELRKHQRLHSACHGISKRVNEQPASAAIESAFTSKFALHDGHFIVQYTIRYDPKDPEFVYLFACHTTVGDDEER